MRIGIVLSVGLQWTKGLINLKIWLDGKRVAPKDHVLVREVQDAKALIESREKLASITDFPKYRVASVNIDTDNTKHLALIEWLHSTKRNYKIVFHGVDPKRWMNICKKHGFSVSAYKTQMGLFEVNGMSCYALSSINYVPNNGGVLVYAESVSEARQLAARYTEFGEKGLKGNIWRHNQDYPDRGVIADYNQHVDLESEYS